jgi:hypothetical protein
VRVAAGRPATLRLHLVDEAGGPTPADAGVTISVLDGAGGPLYTAQAATAEAGPDAVYTWKLPPQAKLDALTATWAATVAGVAVTVPAAVDVIARRLIEPWILQQDKDLADLPAESLLILLDQGEELIRDVVGYPPVLEGVRVTWDSLRGTLGDAVYVSGTLSGLPYGMGAGRMLIPGVKFPQQFYSGSVNGVAMDPVNDIAKLSVQNGALAWTDYRPWISGRYAMWLTHGDPKPPRDLSWACGKLVKHAAKTFDYPDRATMVITEGATISLGLATPDRPTGIPEVDAVLVRARLGSVI